MVIDKNEVKALYDDVRELSEDWEGLDNIPCEEIASVLFRHIKKTDYVPADLVVPVLKVVSLFYDKTGTGYTGVMKEIAFRVNLYGELYGKVLFREFFVHQSNQKDVKKDGKTMEIKTGCGNWLYSSNSDFSAIVRNYSRRKELIHWDYKFSVETKKAGKQDYHVQIETEWKTLFDFLRDFNGNLNTWFKENAKSGEHGTYIYEMQTVRTSKKKADYLLTFDDWKREKGI